MSIESFYKRSLWRGGGCTCVPGLNFKTCCFLYFILFFIFALSFVAVTISTDVFLCCLLPFYLPLCIAHALSQQHVTCQHFTVGEVVANESFNAYKLIYAMNK